MKHKNCRKGQLVSAVNQEKRFFFSESLIASGERMANWHVSDETSVQLYSNRPLITLKRADDPARIAQVPKFGAKCAFWGVISRNGAGPLVELKKNERLNAQSYSDIITDYYLPWVDSYFGRENVGFVQDAAACHTARSTLSMFSEQGITLVEFPPQSPDLSAVEFCWHDMKEAVRHAQGVETIEDVARVCHEFWESLTPERCNSYFNHACSNLYKVRDSKGGPILDGTKKVFVYN